MSGADLGEFERGLLHTVLIDSARRGRVPDTRRLSDLTGAATEHVRRALRALHDANRIMLAQDSDSIRMAHPFSGIPTHDVVRSDGLEWYANCAWDTFGILAATGRDGTVHSRCAESGVELSVSVTQREGPAHSDFVAHFAVPAARWWDDIGFT